MDSALIRRSIDNLACQVSQSGFSYNELINQNPKNSFLATQTALSHCYKYQFNAELTEKAKLFGNLRFYEFRARLEQDFDGYIKKHLLVGKKDWDTSKSPEAYLDFLESLIRNHSSFDHPFFTQFISKKATKEELRFYLAQESSPRFDDLLALIQIGNPMQMKMELAKNYWDEMGNGDFSKVHATMFAKVLHYFNVTEDYAFEKVLATSLVSDNLSAMLAIHREYYLQAIGFLAVTEFCVPLRFKHFIEGCRRLGLDEDILSYHILHTDIDGDHAEGWFREIVAPLIAKNPSVANKITEGALLKLNSSQHFFEGILANLGYESSNSNQSCDLYA